MDYFFNAMIGVSIPFICTTIGASLVYILKDNIKEYIDKLLLGLASGLMVAASIWSLLIPSLESSNIIITSIGFILGILLMIFIDYIIKYYRLEDNKQNNMLMLAVTIHNIPEGMAVGVAFAGVISGNGIITLAGAFSLAIGIAIQNIPEGTIISMPLKASGYSKNRAFMYGVLSGAVEPIFAVLTILLINLLGPILPVLLSLAAGCMFYVVINELLPVSQHGLYRNFGTIGFTIGFLIMMILDVVLS